MLNARELFNRIMDYQAVARIPVWSVETVTEGAIRYWIRDGGFSIGMSPSDVINLDPKEIIRLDTDPLPSFVPRTIAEDDRWRTTIDTYGFAVKTLKEQGVGPKTYYYVAGIVRARQDWEELRKRYDPADQRRKLRSWGPELIDHYNSATCPLGMRIDWGPGRGVKNGYAMGLECFQETLIEVGRGSRGVRDS